jgi:hypothetical protein
MAVDPNSPPPELWKEVEQAGVPLSGLLHGAGNAVVEAYANVQVSVFTGEDPDAPSLLLTVAYRPDTASVRGESVIVELNGAAALALAKALQSGGAWVASQEARNRAEGP